MKNTVWQVLGIVLAIVAIIAAYNIYFIGRPVKAMQVLTDAASPLVSIRPEASGIIQILYNGQPVKNPQIFQIKIKNSGNQPIAPGDYARPLLFSFTTADEIIDVSVINSQPPNVGLIVKKTALNQATASETLLNPGDTVTVRFVVAESGDTPIESHFGLDGRIVGVQAIDFLTLANQSKQTSPASQVLFTSIATAIGALISSAASFFIAMRAKTSLQR